ncbi:tripartite tricarboxylate transporter TctB family protein [Diaphorobacter sp. HDW4A]|uniref:tripartite tricarboxylate transporter TctB family protein n=1 Tax=Diaphorobacter sp. HDW4A TaxID=2714924 RepID=UPI00140B3207|nr:tripartite tricarboxylate transporter TctB family protein [Diaphorobacter sp. HDW4A]QIL82242.1 tripartite tricarboxylate transporter TctB family protein [Diaphorobacter sp. HDW4A]
MSDSSQTIDDHGAERGISRRSVEWAVAFILFALAALVIWDNQRIGAGWDESTGPQAGYFPLRIGIAVAIAALCAAWQAFRHKGDELFATWSQLKSVSQVLVPLTIYIALIGTLGIYVASALFIAAFMRFAGGYAWWKSIALGVLTNVIVFVVFEIQFKVPLPKGPLEAWLGY